MCACVYFIAKASSGSDMSPVHSDTAEESSSKSLLSEDDRRTPTSLNYRVYGWRWFMLATIFLLNVNNGMVSSAHKCKLRPPYVTFDLTHVHFELLLRYVLTPGCRCG